MDTMYETLLQMPLFQGLGEDEITKIVGKVKLHFQKFKAGSVIFKKGDLCNQLVFLLKGELMIESDDLSGNFVLKEFSDVPGLIELHSLFGINTNYAFNYIAESDVDLITVDKLFILSELDKYEIFRMNFRNIISNRVQQLQEKLWSSSSECLETKLVDFLVNRCERPSGKKLLKIKMEDLALMIGETRLSVSKLLNNLEKDGLIILRRTEIEVPDLYQLKVWRDQFVESLTRPKEI
ncbi:Crp/Fnr family transcriptional regulator [Bacteroides sedimenti]|uniref:Crp/Fnr family transcriptional regulator n=1 Tax=Bacteroides sedimenti TaxID=2136147 RepID=A0ABN6ZAP7_9BACE